MPDGYEGQLKNLPVRRAKEKRWWGAVQVTIGELETARNALSVIGFVAAASLASILVKLLLTT